MKRPRQRQRHHRPATARQPNIDAIDPDNTNDIGSNDPDNTNDLDDTNDTSNTNKSKSQQVHHRKHKTPTKQGRKQRRSDHKYKNQQHASKPTRTPTLAQDTDYKDTEQQ
jgi:hypothetical protein